MKREARPPGSNRAVTPLFRLLGGNGPRLDGDRIRLGNYPGSHRGEFRFLGVAMPLVLGVAVWDGLERLGGPWLAWLAVLPVLFVAVHVLTFGLRLRGPAAGFWGWTVILTIWAAWAVFSRSFSSHSWVAEIAALWLVFVGLQAVAAVPLGVGRLLAIGGRRGQAIRVAIVVALHLGMAWAWWRWGWPAGLACGATIAGLACWGTLRPASRWFGPVVTRVVGVEPLLTIDDGPDPDDTPVILDALDRHGVKAVFFVIGQKVREHPELAREIVRRGHELGNHTMTHPQATMWCAGPVRTRREIDEGQRAIEEVTGQRPRWFRAPVGHRNFFTHPVLAEHGLELVAWSQRAFDTVETDVERMVERLTADPGDGGILLMHEATPVARRLIGPVLERLAGSAAVEDDEVVVEGGGAPQRSDPDLTEG